MADGTPNPVDMGQSVSVRRVLGQPDSSAVELFVADETLKEILDYSALDVRRESGGFLVGQVQHAPSLTVNIRHFVPAVDARSKATSLTFTHETWARLNQEVDRRFKGLHVVGWHHTHPGLGVFLSGYDLFVHENFFRQPWQVALVVDPVAEQFSFFHWRGEHVVSCGFACVYHRAGRNKG